MKKYNPLLHSILFVVVTILALMTIGFTDSGKATLTIGGGVVRMINVGDGFDVRLPVTIPFSLNMDQYVGGCTPKNKTLAGNIKGFAHVVYNPKTGENYFRLEEARYEVILSGGEAKIQEVK